MNSILTIIHLPSVTSTMDVALEKLKEGAAVPPFVVVGDNQLTGRGRHGKVWSSPQGNFYGTFALPHEEVGTLGSLLGVSVSLSIARTLKEVAPQLSLICKWPNDVLASQKKISGILLEPHFVREEAVMLMGVGVNLTNSPGSEVSSYETTSLFKETGISLDNLTFLELFWNFFNIYKKLKNEILVTLFMENSYKVGTPVCVEAGKKKLRGTFEGLDKNGALILAECSGIKHSLTTGHAIFESNSRCY